MFKGSLQLARRSSDYIILFHCLTEHQEAHFSLNHRCSVFYNRRALGDIKVAAYMLTGAPLK